MEAISFIMMIFQYNDRAIVLKYVSMFLQLTNLICDISKLSGNNLGWGWSIMEFL